MGDVINFLSSRMDSYGKSGRGVNFKVIGGINEESERLDQLNTVANKLADRFAAGEFSNSYVMEIAQFLDVPNEKLAELYLLLDAIDDRR